VYLYQIIHYSMQQVFIWSQLADPFPGNSLSFPVIGHNSHPISEAIPIGLSLEQNRPAKNTVPINRGSVPA
jgi:hypothetical protein